jgi:hypothetical protein
MPSYYCLKRSCEFIEIGAWNFNRLLCPYKKSFRSHYGPGVDSASNRNEYQEYFLVVKAAGA